MRVLLKLGAAVVGLAAVIGASGPAKANVFMLGGVDPRIAYGRTGPERAYAPIGVITTDAPVSASDDGERQIRTRGTAFLVSPCYLLTNYHAVFGLDYDGPDEERDYSVTFSVGADPDYAFRWRIRGVPVRWGAFNKHKEHDWALVKLDACVGGQHDVGWLETASVPTEAMPGLAVALAGYPSDKSTENLWVQPVCRIEAVQGDTEKVLHGCAVRAGASGGPLMELDAAGTPTAVAIQCGELNSTADPLGSYDPRHANTAVTLSEVFEDEAVLRLIQADRAAFPTPNPALTAPPPAPRAPAVPTLVAQAVGLP
jgi:V8-like Glu-specific endopeptidase